MPYFNFLPEYSYPLYRPPSEANSLIFQITEGCSYNKCSFCGMYITKKFRIRPFDEFKEEVDRMPFDFRTKIKRIFLADGDAAIYPTKGLIKILDYINEKFPNLERISSYAGPQAIKQKSIKEWTEIYKRKLTLLYFGLESGNDEVLKIMNKGMSAKEIKPKVIEIQNIGIKFSVMVILGGGGIKFSKQHAIDTANWISDVNPAFLGILTIFLGRKMNYFDDIGKPTIRDLLEETKLIIENINAKGIIFRSNHISNMFVLKGVLSEDRARILKELEEAYLYLDSQNMLDVYPDYRAGEF